MSKKAFESKGLKLAESHRCQVLDQDGNQCKEKAVRRVKYHGDSEIYPHHYDKPSATWVIIYACKKHLEVL